MPVYKKLFFDDFIEFLLLHSTILEPDFYLTLCQFQCLTEFNPSLAGKIWLSVEFLFELEGLMRRIGLTAAFFRV